MIDKANRWDCKARDNCVSAGVGEVFRLVLDVEDNRNSCLVSAGHVKPQHNDLQLTAANNVDGQLILEKQV